MKVTRSNMVKSPANGPEDPASVELVVCWFRRDLRLEDHTALHHALSSGYPVLPLFIFDTEIIEELPADDARLSFIYSTLRSMHGKLREGGSGMQVEMGEPLEVWTRLITRHSIRAVYVNRDYEPYARERDSRVEALLRSTGIAFHSYKDQVIFEKGEVLKNDGKPYTVFTPYKRKWIARYLEEGLPGPKQVTPATFLKFSTVFPGMEQLGLKASPVGVAPYDLGRVAGYPGSRDLPALESTTGLSPHLRFGTVSIRQVISSLGPEDEVFLSELIWREFFMQILYHFPRVVDGNFHRKYDGLRWRNREEEFERWSLGMTGFPLVDAGMRQLNESGTMHNRVRMVTAGFLCKHLLIDWRLGEAYFASKLLDYELSSNNGNWQWAAGTGCDAAPYFRVFNPAEQLRKFDPGMAYVKRWVPEYGSPGYPLPMVDHREARERAISTYKEALK